MAISTRIYNEQALSMLNRITGQIQDDQSRIATGKNVLRASDNPAVSTKISFTKDQQMMLNRFNVNIDRATNRLGQAEVAIGTIVNILQRTYELSIQARNGTNSPADLKTIGTEISNLRDQMLSLSNSQDVSGNYLFAGYRVHDKPFIEDDNGVVKHNGDAAADAAVKYLRGDNGRIAAGAARPGIHVRHLVTRKEAEQERQERRW